jgi:hypothetical protein
MKHSYIQKLFTAAFIIPCFFVVIGSKQLPEITPEQDVKFAGLTKTLTNLFKTRNPKKFIAGAYEISMENLINKDIATIFDCDSVINKYLSESGEDATYEMLSDILENTFRDHFDNEDGSFFVNVLADTTSDGLHFDFSVFSEKPVSVPIILNASDSSFSTSFDTTCTVKFEADIELFVNTKIANTGFAEKAARIRINKYLFELSSDTDTEGHLNEDNYGDRVTPDISEFVKKPQKTLQFNIEGEKYTAAIRDFELSARSYWYLTPPDATDFMENEEHCYTLLYEQLGKGEFKWDNINLSSFIVDLIMIPETEKWDSLTVSEQNSEFTYNADDLFSDEGSEQISLCCDYSVKDGVSVRSKRYALK